MADYIVYHNPDSMGYPATQIRKFAIVTNKRVKNAIGDRVWLITGEGQPRNYYLRLYFAIESIDSAEDTGFRTRVSGTHGQFLEPMAKLDDEDWLPELKQTMGNFGLGFERISSVRIINGLERLAGQAVTTATGN
jgi:hypothetical protein